MRRMVFILPLAVFMALLSYFAAGLKRDPSKIPTVLINQPVPAFDLAPIEGYTEGLNAHDLRGEVLLLNIFASWCPPCRIEHPLLMELAARDEIPIMGLNWKDPPGKGTAWLQQLGDPYRLIGNDANGRIAIEFGVTGAPETFIIDKMGRIRYKQVGPITPQIWREDIAPIIKELRDEGEAGFMPDDRIDGVGSGAGG